MVEAFAHIAGGVVAMVVVSALIWVAKRKLQSSSGEWSGEGVATAIALMLVGGLVMAGAQLVAGLLVILPDALLGTSAGLIAFAAVPIVVCRFLDLLVPAAASAVPSSVATGLQAGSVKQ